MTLRFVSVDKERDPATILSTSIQQMRLQDIDKTFAMKEKLLGRTFLSEAKFLFLYFLVLLLLSIAFSSVQYVVFSYFEYLFFGKYQNLVKANLHPLVLDKLSLEKVFLTAVNLDVHDEMISIASQISWQNKNKEYITSVFEKCKSKEAFSILLEYIFHTTLQQRNGAENNPQNNFFFGKFY